MVNGARPTVRAGARQPAAMVTAPSVAVREHREEEALHGHLDLGAHEDVLDHRRTAYDVSADRRALVDEREAPIGGIPRPDDHGRRREQPTRDRARDGCGNYGH